MNGVTVIAGLLLSLASEPATAGARFSPTMGAVSVSAGFRFRIDTGIVFLSAEVTALDVGDIIGLSLGIRGEAGYCVTRCIDSELHGRYVSPNGLLKIHLPFIGAALNVPELDLYVGGFGGPAYYWFRANDASATRQQRIWFITPMIGGRAPILKDGSFYVFFEGTWAFGLGNERVRTGFENPLNREANHAIDVAPAGPRFGAGVGFRF